MNFANVFINAFFSLSLTLILNVLYLNDARFFLILTSCKIFIVKIYLLIRKRILFLNDLI